MSLYSFIKVEKEDLNLIKTIAKWYSSEWNIAEETTVQQITNFPAAGLPFQVIMKADNIPVATAGLYNHVKLVDFDSRFSKYGPWLALVYTTTENRNKGYGTLLCKHIEEISCHSGLKKIYLYTSTAEKLYRHLGWEEVERLAIQGREIVVMKKEL
ncbi:GNAT family N-acetyltransferase [Cohnella herbarum]|uniref:GNAT family N-acetyltransferase n=1 Tax=Cohnella herbarum TaxID=2728023 RepID=A0A7Z2VN32_9BACL|nr:GNAT family N-acetyltransferase [Cohnella herbarum]QJD85960.1 GNAT family N-acetyltransferase [Cohnella herbarum]